MVRPKHFHHNSTNTKKETTMSCKLQWSDNQWERPNFFWRQILKTKPEEKVRLMPSARGQASGSPMSMIKATRVVGHLSVRESKTFGKDKDRTRKKRTRKKEQFLGPASFPGLWRRAWKMWRKSQEDWTRIFKNGCGDRAIRRCWRTANQKCDTSYVK